MSDQLPKRVEEGHGNVVAPVPEPGTKSWVVFDDETVPNPLPGKSIKQSDVDPLKREEPKAQIEDRKKLPQDNSPAVITTESVQFNLDKSLSRSMSESANNNVVRDPKLRNVELPVATVEPIRQGFCKCHCIILQILLVFRVGNTLLGFSRRLYTGRLVITYSERRVARHVFNMSVIFLNPFTYFISMCNMRLFLIYILNN